MRLSPFNPQPRAIVSLDLDGSLVGPDTRNSVKLLNKLHDEKKVFTMVNTGNDLVQLKKYGYGQILQGLKVDAVSLDDGQEVYFNRTLMTAEEWFPGLRKSDMDGGWTKVLGANGWDRHIVNRVKSAILAEIDASGFDPEMYVREDKPKFEFYAPTDEAGQARARKFAKGIQTRLADQGISVDYDFFVNPGRYKICYRTPGHSKRRAIDFVLGRVKNVTGVVTLGDSHNDVPMLTAQTFKNKKCEVPNYPTLVGGDPQLTEALEGRETAHLTHKVDVSEALASQVQAAIGEKGQKLSKLA